MAVLIGFVDDEFYVVIYCVHIIDIFIGDFDVELIFESEHDID